MNDFPRILALDLGTSTGFATQKPGESSAGTWLLATDKDLREAKRRRLDRRLDIRVSALWRKLEWMHSQFALQWIVFEDVKFAKSQAQAHLWASFRGAVWAFAHHHKISTDCLDTGKLKIFATGSGSAEKSAMARALVAKNPDVYALGVQNTVAGVFHAQTGEFFDDNAVDALHLYQWAYGILKNA